jgi:argininosuccinate lyase
VKLWGKGIELNKKIEEFTVGRDRELDLLFAKYDVLGSIAHIIMLQKVGLLSMDELSMIHKELIIIFNQIEKGDFIIENGIEDVHSQVEFLLTKRLGDIGKKIHSARSRNDQVLLDIKLFTRAKIHEIVASITNLFNTLTKLSEKHKNDLMPGYTHLQVAMPSSFGLWFGAYAESLADDLQVLLAAYKISNQNPLGSAAGYGSSFPIDRQLTTDLLGFDNMNYNVVYAQMTRGKTERIVAQALGTIAATLSKLSFDICLFLSQNFGFLSLSEEFTTGSSIMPHKKNPDVFELVRAKSNKIQAIANEVICITNNLPSGYFRDFQVIKESYIAIFDYLKSCIEITDFALSGLIIKQDLLLDEKYKYIFSVEELNKKVLSGIPFREAYQIVGESINNKTYSPSKDIKHTHSGSIDNLCTKEIEEKFEKIALNFNKDKIQAAERDLLIERI